MSPAPPQLEATVCRIAAARGWDGVEPVFSGVLHQAWNPTPESGFHPGVVQLFVDTSALHVFAAMNDHHIENRADGFNQRTWETGDVFEIFLQTEPDTYFEFHVTPENRNLFLRWTSALFEQHRKSGEKGGSFQQALIGDPRFLRSETTVDEGARQWTVAAEIPFANLGIDPFAGASATSRPGRKFAFCRYDADPDAEAPVLSATAPFSQPSFHDRSAWHDLPVPLVRNENPA